MTYADDAQEVRASGRCPAPELNSRVDRAAEAALRAETGSSVVEHALLVVMRRQRGRDHLRMAQVARATALSESATTRLVDRLEERALLARYLCTVDRRCAPCSAASPRPRAEATAGTTNTRERSSDD